MTGGLEHLFIVGGFGRLQQKHLYQGARSLAEVHARLDDLGIVEDHQRPLRQIVRQVIEDILPYLTLPVDEQFGLVTTGHRELGDPLVRKRIVIVADMDMSGICHLFRVMRMRHGEGRTGA